MEDLERYICDFVGAKTVKTSVRWKCSPAQKIAQVIFVGVASERGFSTPDITRYMRVCYETVRSRLEHYKHGITDEYHAEIDRMLRKLSVSDSRKVNFSRKKKPTLF